MEQRWQQYVKYFQGQECATNSPIWSKLVKDFRFESLTPASLSLEIQAGARGYFLVSFSNWRSRLNLMMQMTVGWFELAVQRFGSHFERIVHFIVSNVVRSLSKKNSKKDYAIYDKRVYAIWRFLKKTGVNPEELPAYFKDTTKIKYNYNSLKNFYFFKKLTAHVDLRKKKSLRVIEVGAGAANLAMLISKCRADQDQLYVIVDLPEMILVSSHEIAKYLPTAKQVLPHEFDETFDFKDFKGHNFLFLIPQQLEKLPSDQFDLCINVESFAEMNPEIAFDYLRSFYRCLGNNGKLFVCNRENRTIDTDRSALKVLSFWSYPFQDTDEILLQEYCPMRDAIYHITRRNINRISAVKKAPV